MMILVACVVVAFTACNSNADKKAALTAREWQLEQLTVDGNEVDIPVRMPMVQFSDTNRVYGFAGCNRFFGPYTLEGNTLNIGNCGATMMACPNLDFERQFLKAFSGDLTCAIVDTVLTLTGEGKTLVFIPKQPVPEPVEVTYVGGDGRTKMLYQATVTYYPAEERAVVRLDDQQYELWQQVSASGVRYANEEVTLLGKGEEITLTLPDGKELTMTAKQ